MFNTILVALDPMGSDVVLMKRAIALAKATHASLKLLSVLTADGNGIFVMANPQIAGHNHSLNDWNLFQERYQVYKDQCLAMLRGFAEQATVAGVQADFNQASGSPGRIICQVAKAEKVDLVMVGSHGYHGLDEMLLGSVSNYVMHHASCSVIVVHPQHAIDTQNKALQDNVIASSRG